MTACPDQVVRILRIRGVTVRVEAGHLAISRKHGEIPADMVQLARHFKPLIIAELEREAERAADEAELEATAAAILRLTDDERDELRREIEATPADDPHLAFDRDAFQRAEWLKDLNDDTEAA